MQLRKKVDEAVDWIQSKGISNTEIGIILGTGLGKLGQQIEEQKIVEYSTIPHFMQATVEFHEGKLIAGKLSGRNVLAMNGRFHFYEGYSMQEITFPIYVMKALGVKELIISNAAGNLDLGWSKGELMLIEDHINLLPENPLRGQNDNSFGPRFPDMSEPYSRSMNRLMTLLSEEAGITLRKGVYVSVPGPNLETAAEYRYLKTIGANAVGMSTVPEVIVAKYLGIPVCAISVLTDDCDPDNLKPVNIEEILKTAATAEVELSSLINLYLSKRL